MSVDGKDEKIVVKREDSMETWKGFLSVLETAMVRDRELGSRLGLKMEPY